MAGMAGMAGIEDMGMDMAGMDMAGGDMAGEDMADMEGMADIREGSRAVFGIMDMDMAGIPVWARWACWARWERWARWARWACWERWACWACWERWACWACWEPLAPPSAAPHPCGTSMRACAEGGRAHRSAFFAAVHSTSACARACISEASAHAPHACAGNEARGDEARGDEDAFEAFADAFEAFAVAFEDEDPRGETKGSEVESTRPAAATAATRDGTARSMKAHTGETPPYPLSA